MGLGPTQPPVQCVPSAISILGPSGQGLELTVIYTEAVNGGAAPPFSWCRVELMKHVGNLQRRTMHQRAPPPLSDVRALFRHLLCPQYSLSALRVNNCCIMMEVRTISETSDANSIVTLPIAQAEHVTAHHAVNTLHHA
jgi:hypothetical protein